MDTTEYMAFVPLLIYGIGLADLLGQWKRFFDRKTLYVPYLLMTIVLTETAIYNVFIYLNLVEHMGNPTYLGYVAHLFPPFLFMLTTNAYTPDEGTETKAYFNQKMPVFFGLMAAFIASHFLFDFGDWDRAFLGRMVAIALLTTGAVLRKAWFTYVVFGFWLVTFTIMRGNLTLEDTRTPRASVGDTRALPLQSVAVFEGR
jgi:hypothetical protein